MSEASLPVCRYRGSPVGDGQWVCNSPKLVAPAGLVAADVCRHVCPFVDHGVADVGEPSGARRAQIQLNPPVQVILRPECLEIALITAPRPVRTVDRSIQELRQAGFTQEIQVFAEPDSRVEPQPGLQVRTNAQRLGLWRNWLHAATYMLANRTAPFILICEDDIRLAPCAALALQHAIDTY